jgi:putative flippase GtrA
MRAGKEFLFFAIVGVVGFGVDLAVLYLIAPLLGWYGARGVSFLAAATTTWVLNRRYTFTARESESSLLGEYAHYLLTMLGGSLVNYAVYVLTLHWLDGPFAPAAGVALGSCAGLAINFLSARYLVFKTARKR